jgi:hypothetical protein
LLRAAVALPRANAAFASFSFDSSVLCDPASTLP